ncbi:MAG: hypothetical protein J5959_18890 [Butyrivibrio sp.]|nr:hypothetical protein [Butyrivibrio sp.]
MTGKKTKAKKLIERIGGLYGVNYDNKTYKNIREVLESHRQILFNKHLFNYQPVGSEPLEKLIPYIYRCFISNSPIDNRCVNKMVLQILNDKKTNGILQDTLEEIKKFAVGDEGNDKPIGATYYEILDRLYFKELDPVKTLIYSELDMDSHVFSYRMEEAVMLFGIYFWQRCLSLLPNWHDIAEKIREEEGRNDLNLGLA